MDICGAWMPRLKITCARNLGHAGSHRSPIATNRITERHKRLYTDEQWAKGRYEKYRYKQAFYGARKRAIVKGVPFTIKLKDIPDIPSHCPMLGIPLIINHTRGAGDSSPSLDRIIPDLGYVSGNIHWISQKANRIKNNATFEEIFRVAEYLKELMQK